jgi:hypothetical protein
MNIMYKINPQLNAYEVAAVHDDSGLCLPPHDIERIRNLSFEFNAAPGTAAYYPHAGLEEVQNGVDYKKVYLIYFFILE